MTHPSHDESIETSVQDDNMQNEQIVEEASVEDSTASAEVCAEQRIQALEEKAEENYQLAIRAKAEVENVKRRSDRDVSNARKYALERFVDDLIPVMDSLEQGMNLQLEGSEAESMREGLALTMKLFTDAMAKHGIEKVDPEGHPFNPEHHEAMSMIESHEVEPNHVLKVFQKGYLLHGRVVRPARVIVARGPSKPLDEKA
ncbi:MAG: nucleotide exchange factor GrpE [Gammaproteobacteria bacterium CG22_combo_CG10-13_8_21_14_all_40_8]|nr:MAG: nucleotide exchange factor GrpE [Gammaproteobacteria bacterium CG22_combo_CG10-13_8_21_14_all_40_8]